MSFRYFKLFSVDRIIILEKNFVGEIFSSTQIELVDANGVLVFIENVQVFCFKLFRHFEISFLFDFLTGKLSFWHFR